MTDFAVALSAGKQKVKKPLGMAEKRKYILFKSHFFRAQVGRAKQRSITVGLGNCVGRKFLCEV